MSLAASVVVVSRGRPLSLARTLLGLEQQAHPAFEVVVVADPPGIAAAAPWAGRVKAVPFDRPNISAARNLGLLASAGEAVAFLDDDAVPEPLWLGRLLAPLADPSVACVGGFVRGPDGLAWQWRGREVMADGSCRPLEGAGPFAPGRAVKTEGTNMAVRRAALLALGGFDEAFRFYLDETDLNWRLARAGHRAALAPRAVVHHGAAPSARRAASGAPLSLHEVGASLAVWRRRHGEAASEREDRRRALLRRMVMGRIEPPAVGRLLATYDEGLREGEVRALPPLGPIAADPPPLLPFGAPPLPHRMVAGGTFDAGAARARARGLRARGHVVTLLLLSRTALPHRVAFEEGLWVQRGGLWGRSEPGDPAFRPWSRAARVRREAARVAPERGGPGA